MDLKREILKQLYLFLALVVILTTGLFLWLFLGSKENMTAVLLMMWTPGLSALFTSIILKDKIRDYGWKPGKIKFLGFAYLLPLIVSAIAYGIFWLGGFGEFTAQQVVNYKWAKMLGFELPAPFIIGALSKMSLGFLLTCLPVLGEEIGWSGFLTPKLLKISSIHVTSLIVGIFWSAWHYPAIIGGFYGTGTPLWIALPGFTLVLTGYSFMRTVLVSKSNSLWTGVVLHSSGNIILMGMFWEMTVQKNYAAYFVSETGILTGIVSLFVSFLFMKSQKKNN
ncbi:MAG: CPBP family intramembrane metalloprotease [Ignavibacteriae bacterium]|nr:CPBP family intramembrane metalloprotease [Ignavibacteriota bacterium]